MYISDDHNQEGKTKKKCGRKMKKKQAATFWYEEIEREREKEMIL